MCLDGADLMASSPYRPGENEAAGGWLLQQQPGQEDADFRHAGQTESLQAEWLAAGLIMFGLP